MRQRKGFCYSNVTQLRISKLYFEITLKTHTHTHTQTKLHLPSVSTRYSFTYVESNELEKRFAKGLAPQALVSNTAQGFRIVIFWYPSFNATGQCLGVCR